MFRQQILSSERAAWIAIILILVAVLVGIRLLESDPPLIRSHL